ncbi:MAG: hypothetical protein QM635_09595 [Microbacteriaceae bacterium]
MRFVFAIVSVVIAAVMIGTGVAQQTVLKLPDHVTVSVHLDSTAPVTVIDGSVMRTFPNTQKLRVTGDAEQRVFAAVGSTVDVDGWVGEASHNVLSYDADTRELVNTVVSGSESTVPDPAGSDLWYGEYSGTGRITQKLLVNAEKSIVIVGDGSDAAPADVSITWSVDNSTPWATPLLLGGAVVLIVGLALLLWAILRVRSARGPRRKTPKMPKLPKRPRYKPSRRTRAQPGATGPRLGGRRSSRRLLLAPAVLAIAAVGLAGCTAEPTPEPSQTATSTADASTDTAAPAVTAAQAATILERIRAVADQADSDMDATLAATRFAGPALEQRTANYTIRKDDKDNAEAVAAIPDGDPEILLPQQTELWPRTVFVVAGYTSDSALPPLAMMLVQQDARSNYMVQYAISLEPGAVIPGVAETSVGAPQLDPDTSLLKVVPSQLAAEYGDILINDDASAYFASFDESNDSLRDSVGAAAKKKRQKALPDTAKLVFSNAPGDGSVIVLATIDAGALVAVELNETETVKPVETGATVSAPDDVRALSKVSTSDTGINAVYSDQLLFFVPGQTDTSGLVTLLGYASGLVSASEVKK